MGSLVRDFVKFDDEATTLERFAESAMQAYRIAMTPPRGPVVLVVDAALQESQIADRARPRIPILSMASPPQGDANAVREAARLLVNAETPLIQTPEDGTHAERLGSCRWSWPSCCRRRSTCWAMPRGSRFPRGIRCTGPAAPATRRTSRSASKSSTCRPSRAPRERMDARRSAFPPSTCFSTATSTTSGAMPTSIWRLRPTRKRRCPRSSKKCGG